MKNIFARFLVFTRARGIDASAIATWILGCGLVVYLSLMGGGYETIARNELGIAIWWLVLLGTVVGALPLSRTGRMPWVALGLLVAFAAWTGLSLLWTESHERTGADLGRIATFVGVFGLALLTRGRRGTRRMVAAVGTGIAIVALLALLSRLQPGLFPGASGTAEHFPTGAYRLSFPLSYWNGVAALIAIGVPLMLYVATEARSTIAAGLASAVLPAMTLALFFTFSRGGMIAAAVGLTVFMIIAYDRLPKVATMLITGAGSGVLIILAEQRTELADGMTDVVAQRQGDELLTFTVLVAIAVGLVQMGLTYGLKKGLRPGWALVSARTARLLTLATIGVVVLGALAFDAPGKASDAWDEFSSPGGVGASGSERLASVQGSQRDKYWEIALDQASSAPLIGTGAGTYEFWFNRDEEAGGFVRDAHSLYLETLGELGIIGFALLLGFLGTILIGGITITLRSSDVKRSQLGAALAGCVAFLVTALADWTWEIAVIPVTFFLLAAALLSAPHKQSHSRNVFRMPWGARIAVTALSLAAILAIAVPLTTEALVRESRIAAQGSDWSGAEIAANTAVSIHPGAATPRIQLALTYEVLGELESAELAARAATEREATNWRTWLTLARIQAKRGDAEGAVRSARRVAELNPRLSYIR